MKKFIALLLLLSFLPLWGQESGTSLPITISIEDYTKLMQILAELKIYNQNLEEKLQNLKKSSSDWEIQYQVLESQFLLLEQNYQKLEEKYKISESSYLTWKTLYEELLQEYKKLKISWEELKTELLRTKLKDKIIYGAIGIVIGVGITTIIYIKVTK